MSEKAEARSLSLRKKRKKSIGALLFTAQKKDRRSYGPSASRYQPPTQRLTCQEPGWVWFLFDEIP